MGTIVSPASVKTNNQAEVLAVRDGKHYGSRFVFKTHKAETMELKLATFVFYPLGFPDTKEEVLSGLSLPQEGSWGREPRAARR